MRKSAQLISFLQHGKTDKRLTPTHVSFFLALYCCREQNNQRSHFRISRKVIMELARIQSTATYHKCVKELSAFGYIEYKPSFHPLQGSEVKLLFEINLP